MSGSPLLPGTFSIPEERISPFIAFITGLTAGSLGCLAVHGGLLAGCLARHLEANILSADSDRAGSTRSTLRAGLFPTIAIFLLAKLTAYTMLGFLVGGLGSLLQFSPLSRALMMIGIGLFMVGSSLRMLRVHPLFRYFALPVPFFMSRFIRRNSRSRPSRGSPVFLGVLTVLLPCGVTQTVVAAAVGTGDPVQGGVLLFCFILGTIPLFFLVTYSAVRLSARLESYFNRIVALIVAVLGVVSLVYGLNLAGVPVLLPSVLFRTIIAPAVSEPMLPPGTTTDMEKGAAVTGKVVVIKVSDAGFSPRAMRLPAGESVTIRWVTGGVKGCVRSIALPALDYETILPSTGEVSLVIPPQKGGTLLSYSCSTGRLTGFLIFDRH